uniref:Uncharacterized protein n=1 Tax=Astatotilapia calliptera TaxID=8154 RepID=A0AAX7U862_ASTCA
EIWKCTVDGILHCHLVAICVLQGSMRRGVRGLSSQLAALIYTQMFQRMHGCINLHMNLADISKHPYPKCAGHKQNMPNVLLFAEGRKQKNIPVILRLLTLHEPGRKDKVFKCI